MRSEGFKNERNWITSPNSKRWFCGLLKLHSPRERDLLPHSTPPPLLTVPPPPSSSHPGGRRAPLYECVDGPAPPREAARGRGASPGRRWTCRGGGLYDRGGGVQQVLIGAGALRHPHTCIDHTYTVIFLTVFGPGYIRWELSSSF